jgi:hypothetical protein
MSVGRADANGAGSVSPPVPAPATTDGATPAKGKPKAGLADGANTTWSTARKDVSKASKSPASLDFKAIDKALVDLRLAKVQFESASKNYVKGKTEETRAAYEKEADRYRKAKIDLGTAIESETERLAADSSLKLDGRLIKNSAKLRGLEQKILNRAAGALDKGLLQSAINDNRRLRLPGELAALTERMADPWYPADENEAAAIYADAADGVAGKRLDETGLSSDEVTTIRFHRLDEILKGRKREYDICDDGAYARMIKKIRPQMGQLSPASDRKFYDIVRRHGHSCV